MIRLKDKYKGKAALSIMGGPSILENNFDLRRIDRDKYTIFLEAKALTPRFLASGVKPDYFLMFFPDKCQSNSLQHVMYQSFLVDFDLSDLLQPEYEAEYKYYRDNFNTYFEPWVNRKKGYKKYRFRNDAVLKNSPWDLLQHFPDMDIITRCDNRKEKYGPDISRLKNRMYFYDDQYIDGKFDIESYFNPQEIDGRIRLSAYGHVNSSAIALYPLLNYMGFDKVYFLGMDMSLLGSMEYAALYTFKSMRYFNNFFNAARSAYGYDFPLGLRQGLGRFFKKVSNNISRREFMSFFSGAIYKSFLYDVYGLKGKFLRDRKQFSDCRQLFAYKEIEFINIYEPFKYARPIPGIKNITYQYFLNS